MTQKALFFYEITFIEFGLRLSLDLFEKEIFTILNVVVA